MKQQSPKTAAATTNCNVKPAKEDANCREGGAPPPGSPLKMLHTGKAQHPCPSRGAKSIYPLGLLHACTPAAQAQPGGLFHPCPQHYHLNWRSPTVCYQHAGASGMKQGLDPAIYSHSRFSH